MLDDKQVRGARAILNWTQEILAEISGIARATIKNIENGTTVPRHDTMQTLRKTFEEAGIEFLPGSGVRLRDRMVAVFEGKEANRKLLDDIYLTLRGSGGEVLIAGLDETLAVKDLDEAFLKKHLERLAESKVRERLLIREGDTNFVGPQHTYRWIPGKYFSHFPLYVYGPKLALVSWAPIPRCIIIHDEAFAESTRNLFNFVWDRSEIAHKKEEEG